MKQEETRDKVDKIIDTHMRNINLVDCMISTKDIVHTSALNCMVDLLADIAISLSIIADSVCEEDDDEEL